MSDKEEEKEKKDRIGFVGMLKIIRRRLSLRYLLIFGLLLACNSFAWFLYVSKVSTGMSVTVRSWNIAFDNSNLTSNVTIDLTDLYPGIDDFDREISIKNYGDTGARITYEILSYSIFGEKKVINESYTSEDALNDLENNYPFKFDIGVSNEIINAKVGNIAGEEFFHVKVTWPYETLDEEGNVDDSADELDTYWGNKAYEFQQNSTDKPIVINIKITVSQENSEEMTTTATNEEETTTSSVGE